ncbi:hypothetical protein [Streptomyces sp. SID3343]|nr:hypothetical protein [Streptomyces sp. SID3343]
MLGVAGERSESRRIALADERLRTGAVRGLGAARGKGWQPAGAGERDA